MESLTNIDAPGAYPATPSNEEPTFQTQHNTLQNQGDPRGLSSTEQNTHLNSHSLAGPGIYVDEPSLAGSPNAPTLPHENPTQQAQFNQATPRGLGNGDSAGWVNNSTYSRERGNDKPGFMTSTHSRIKTQPSALTQSGNYIYGDIASQSPYGEDARPTNTATNLAAKTPVNSIKKTLGNSYEADHDKIQSGLRDASKTASNEPYWGDIPFGTGVYNGVTGHGSNESTAHQRSLYDQYDAATNSGIYNGVTGHGSKRSTSAESTRYDESTTADNLYHQQRAFPLANNSSTVAITKPNNVDKHMRDSHFKEALASAGATAVLGGYNDQGAKAMDEKFGGEDSTKLGQGKPDALSQTHRHKGEEGVNEYKGEKQTLPYRPFVSIPDQTHTQQKTPDKQPLDTESDSKHQKKEDSSLSKYVTAAAAGGDAAYGVNKYANRDSSKEHSSVPETEASRGAIHQLTQGDTQQVSQNSRTQPHYNMLDGTPSGTASTSVHQPENGSHSGASQSERYCIPSDGNAATGEIQSIGCSSSDSSHGGKYNVLASGTPSGINPEQARAEKQHRREQQQQQSPSPALLNHPPSSPPSHMAAGTALGPSAQYQAANGLPEQLPRAGDEISSGEAFTSGRKVMHRCANCGEENDISQHMMI
ncbi:hypothetical protein CIB48_g8688 [Xylaria polymorpha]|nr:hypothetical protein CIB48_g8688 [Xylaria polymorpha]